MSLNNLAELRRTEGRYAEAERLARRAVEISARATGSESSEFAVSLHTLAAIYRDSGRYEEALSLLERSLAIREKQLGLEHPLVAVTLGNIAEIYSAQRRFTGGRGPGQACPGRPGIDPGPAASERCGQFE